MSGIQTIGSLFASDIHRTIEEVIKVDQTDEDILCDEISEYVVTDSIRSHYTSIYERYAETPNRPHEGIGIWVSGFYGSGKSSFAKMLGLSIENRLLAGIRASDRFVSRAGDPRITVLLDQAALSRVLDFLGPEHFYRENNGQIYRAALNLFREGEPIDNVTMAAQLERQGVLERVGGRGHLALLQESVPTAANVETYARIVRAKADKRALIAASTEGQKLGYDESLDADEAINQAQAALFALSADKVGTGLVRAGELVKPAIDRVDARMASQTGVLGIPSGLADLDRLTRGFKASDLVVLAARPSMGKSAMAFQIAAHVAIDLGRPVAVFSLEMSKEQILDRLLCMRARVDSNRAQEGVLNEQEYERMVKEAGPLEAAPLFIDDSPTLSDLTFRLKARQARAREGVDLILVDYLQLMESKAGAGEGNRVQEVSSIARALKAVARELGIPVIALSQLSRACDARPDKRPMLSDLRESGEIEACADLVLFLYRDEYYNRDKTEKPGIAEVNVAKHRNGPTGSVELVFRRELTRFENLERRRPGGGAAAAPAPAGNGRPRLVPTE